MLFTYANYTSVLDALSGRGLTNHTIVSFVRHEPDDHYFILRHDVEADPRRALDVGRIEHSKGLSATYYFHGPHRGRVFDVAIMRELQGMGHEIGYHYETLDRAGGDQAEARRLFDSDIDAFRTAGIVLETVANHGNPRIKKTDYAMNSDLLREQPDILAANGLLAEASRSLDLEHMAYISDVGVRFAGIDGDVRSYFVAPQRTRVYLMMHTDYWSRSAFRALWLAQLARAMRTARPLARVAWVIKDRVSRLRPPSRVWVEPDRRSGRPQPMKTATDTCGPLRRRLHFPSGASMP